MTRTNVRSPEQSAGSETVHLTVIAPFYNEQENVGPFYNALNETVVSLGIPYDFIFVDDGSTDATLSYLNTLASRDDHISVLSFTRNFGHQIAITAGLDCAQGDAVVVMDSDLQHPPGTLLEMLEKLSQGFDIVYAVRKVDPGQVGVLKHLTSRLYYWLFGLTVEGDVIANSADFRLMSQRTVRALRRMRERHRYLRGMIPWMGYRSTTIEYVQPERFAGETKYTWRRMLRLANDGLFSFSTLPLNVVTGLGLVTILLGLVYLAYVIGRATVIGDLVPGWASVIVVLLVVGGIQLLSIGVIAQYIRMIFEEAKGRPLYLLKQRHMGTFHTNGERSGYEPEQG